MGVEDTGSVLVRVVMGGVVVVVMVEHGCEGVVSKGIIAKGVPAPKEGAEDVEGI